MRFSSQSTSGGISECLFTVGDAPGVLWAPDDAIDGDVVVRPLVLLGHGGGAHKAHESMVARARRYVTGNGFAVAALDAPGWGGRPTPPEYESFNAEIEELTAKGESLGDVMSRRGVIVARLAIPEWRAALDALTALDWIDAGAIGYWGVSLGSAIGIPLVAAERRITAAVLGLMGHQTVADAAAKISVPVEFVLQWDDEMVPRESGLALFDAIGSADKTLHANPGRHANVPGFELDSSQRFFARNLTSPAAGRP